MMVAVIITAMSAIALAAQCSDANQAAFEKWDKDWAKYGDEKNRAELDKIYADDFASIGGLGVTGKKEAIEGTMNAPTPPVGQPAVQYDHYLISCTPNTATITHRNVVRNKKDGKHQVAYSRSVHFLEKRGGRWLAVSSTGNPMADDASMAVNTERDGAKAYKNRNVAWFERHLADNYIGIAPDGSTLNKAQVLENLKHDKTKYDVMKMTDIGVRQDGDTAVITGVYDVSGWTADGKPMAMKLRFTRTLVKKDDDWQAIASQTMVLSEPQMTALKQK